MAKKGTETPLMRQYHKIKEKHPGALLLFRMGDFYETFEEDAVTASQVLGITLTKRGNGKAEDIPLAGFPHHALEAHLPKLVRAGHRVAVCEQLEDPKHARKVVKRGVVEIVTPGVSFHDQLLTPKQANYLAAVVWGREREDKGWVGVAFIDATTGEFAVTEVPETQLPDLMQALQPAELLFDKRQRDRLLDLPGGRYITTPQDDWVFGHDFAYETLLRHFKTHSLKGYGVDDLRLGLIAAGAALYYLGETQKGRVPHVRKLQRYETSDYIALDPQTMRNLELVSSMQDGGREGSLVSILDATQTPMGGRLLRKWLVRPLRNVSQIQKRLDAVDEFFQAPTLRANLRDELGHVGDLERLVARVCTGRAMPRELVALKLSLQQLAPIKALLQHASTSTLQALAGQLTLCADCIGLVDTALVDEPPAQLGVGGVFKKGFHDELDELREIAASGKDYLARLQKSESERTGIPSLKVGFNKVFGYYLEITNAHKDKVPDDYIRKQTLVNAERYITPALKEYEEKILTAEEKIGALEANLFNDLRMQVSEHAEELQKNAQLLAMLDGFLSFAHTADQNGYVRPEVSDDARLEIVDGRHPVVEKTLPPGEPFIPNSVTLDPADEQLLLITGPNMAGKSVVLRQTGLIVLMAQVGAFVPATKAHVGVVDKIFTRVGASDNLAAGESTFLVEMNEAANILNNATDRSLILLDEVGRGTSTFDGLSIAWAIVEYLHEQPTVAARTLFATHYHELTILADRLARVHNACIQVQEHDGKVIFLRKLIPGGSDHSYGIEVAKMAGLPVPVIQRAREVLRQLESQQLTVDADAGDTTGDGAPVAVRTRQAVGALPTPQMSLFTPAAPTDTTALEIKDALRDLDVNRITPIEAMLKLAELKRKADA